MKKKELRKRLKRLRKNIMEFCNMGAEDKMKIIEMEARIKGYSEIVEDLLNKITDLYNENQLLHAEKGQEDCIKKEINERISGFEKLEVVSHHDIISFVYDIKKLIE